MQNRNLFLFSLFISTVIWGQGWESSVNTDISFSGDAFEYDLVGNEMGFHLAVCESNQLKYYHLAADGSILSQTTIASSGAASPAITWQEYNGSKMHIIYHDKTNHYLRIYQSTNDGTSWSSLSYKDIDLYFGDTGTSLRIDATAKNDRYLHITLGDAKSNSAGGPTSQSGSDEHIYYTYYDLYDDEWDQNSTELTDATTSKGWNPTIVLSEKNNIDRIHVVFETSTTITDDEQNYYFERVVERHKLSTLSNWTPVDIISKSLENPLASKNLHLSAYFSHSVCTVYEENLYVAHRYENTYKVNPGDPDSYAYYTVVKKRAIDDTTHLSDGAGGYSDYDSAENAFGLSHALYTDENDGSTSLLWANIRDEELVYQVATSTTPTFGSAYDLSDGNLPMLTSNKASEAFVVWSENGKIWVKRKSREISGDLSQNTLWSGDIYIDGDVTVDSDVTLTVIPDTKVIFDDSDSESGGKYSTFGEIIVNGVFKADGADFVSSDGGTAKGDWGGVWFDSLSTTNAAASYIKNCTLKNGYYPIWIDDCAPLIQNNTIQYHTKTGIVAKGVGANYNCEIVGNSVFDVSNIGISVVGDADPKVYNNDFDIPNRACIYVNTDADGHFYNNECTSGYYEYVKVEDGSPDVGGNGSGRLGNQVLNSANKDDTIFRITGGTPDLGNSNSGDDGNNSLAVDQDTGAYYVYNSSGNPIKAEENWWGAKSPSSGKFYGSVD